MRLAWWYGGQHFINAAEDGFLFAASVEDSHHFWTSLYLDMLEFLEIDDADAAEVLYQTFSNPSNYVLFDDAVPCLEELRSRGLRLGIISNFEGWLARPGCVRGRPCTSGTARTSTRNRRTTWG
jgi:FMN phosphatase YigB (HAD superfamily)